jgi:hypothetical protein
VNRYFFHFRQGDEIARDAVGMYLRDLEAAREEAIRTWRDLLSIAQRAGESPAECEIQIADASGEPVLTIPFGKSDSLH